MVRKAFPQTGTELFFGVREHFLPTDCIIALLPNPLSDLYLAIPNQVQGDRR